MKKIYVGIDISKEKCNLCYLSGLEIVREGECLNEVKALFSPLKLADHQHLFAPVRHHPEPCLFIHLEGIISSLY